MPKSKDVVVLVGPMGVGKTTIGKKLAKALSVPFQDSDVLFTNKYGSISDFFAAEGEERFRELESEIVIEAISNPGVLATGGGAILRVETQAALANSATVIYLSTDGRHMGSRLAHGSRPLLTNGLDSWREIYDSRKPIYESVADFEVDTSGKPLASVIEEIKKDLGA
jgi:shikimate kinase